MAINAHDAHIGIANRQRPALQHGPARRPGVASPATLNPLRRVHVLDHNRMRTRFPFLESGLMRPGVAAAANSRGNLQSWPHRRVIRIGRVVCRRPMAVFALNAFQLRRSRRAHKASGHAVTDCVTGKTFGIILLPNSLQSTESLGMLSAHHSVVNGLVTLDASLRTSIVRGWTRDPKQRVRIGARYKGAAHQVCSRTQRSPGRIAETLFFEKLVITRRSVPRHDDAIGPGHHCGHDWLTRYATGLRNPQLRAV